ncbi:MAG: CpsD/CapB family tyrosine-protein kinase, partial [Cyanothece sp. SIO1E1]|nr:CpsD/CapB family tyrosine-protein kinase [Cyanothece sp. SIO1E1]
YAIQVASFCRGVVMVARMNQITQSHLTQAIERLKKLNAIGIIANSVKDLKNNYTTYTKSISGLPLVDYKHLDKKQALKQQSYN